MMQVYEAAKRLVNTGDDTGCDGLVVVDREAFTKLRQALEGTEVATTVQVAKARAQYGTEEVEIDDHAFISNAMPQGIWVSAWVWLDGEEED